MKRQFITGLLLWLPIWAVFIVIRFIFDIFDGFVVMLPNRFQPESWLGFSFPGLGLIVVLLIVWLTGALTANAIGKWVVGLWEKMLNKIPLVRTIYSAVQQLLSAFIKPKGDSFRQVVLVEYPRRDSWSMGFLTGPATQANETDDDNKVSIFIPTTPNPTSGFLIFVPKDEVRVLKTSVEDAFRMIVSLGVVQPDGDKKEIK